MEAVMPPEPARRKYMRPKEVADYFGVTHPTVCRWVKQGKLTAIYTVGGHRRIVPDKLLWSYFENKSDNGPTAGPRESTL